MRRDPVTPEVRAAVLARDGGCVAFRLGEPGLHRNVWGSIIRWDDIDKMQLDHVQDSGMMGKRAPSDPDHLVTLCPDHHLNGWATSHRPELREYLARNRD